MTSIVADSTRIKKLMENRPETPVCELDDIRVTHTVYPAGKRMTVVSMRNAIFQGVRPSSVEFDIDIIVRDLEDEGHGCWMKDDPQEISQMPVEEVYGDVLVGGLGLGCFSHLVQRLNDNARSVTTVERDSRIIKLIEPHVDASRHKVINDDIYAFARSVPSQVYSSAFLDTWQSTGELCWVNEVVPLRRLIGDKIDTVWCWNEAEMTGQVLMNPGRWAVIEQRGAMVHQRVVQDRAEEMGVRNRVVWGNDGDSLSKVIDAESELLNDSDFTDMLHRFVGIPANEPEWEDEFGRLWDDAKEAIEKQEA